MADITLHPDPQQPSVLNGNKGLLIAIMVAGIIGVIGFSAFLAFDANNQYQGLIKQVESQTQQLKNTSK